MGFVCLGLLLGFAGRFFLFLIPIIDAAGYRRILLVFINFR